VYLAEATPEVSSFQPVGDKPSRPYVFVDIRSEWPISLQKLHLVRYIQRNGDTQAGANQRDSLLVVERFSVDTGFGDDSRSKRIPEALLECRRCGCQN
jgi:hypothetical protein